MTCIAGVVSENGVIIGADSAGSTESGFIINIAEPKVIAVGNIIIGVSNSFKVIQTIRSFMTADEEQGDDYLVTKFLPKLRETLIANNAQQDGMDVEAEMLIGYKGKLYYLSADFALMESSEGYQAIGTGMPYALASLYSTSGLGWSPKLRILEALRCSEKFNAFVRRPWNIIEIDKEDKVCLESM